MIKRFFRHIIYGKWVVYKKFSRSFLKKMETEIGQSEKLHTGEIRFAVEASLDPLLVLKKMSARERAVEIFSNLRIWDTEQNTGVLIYLLLADRNIEIVADRGIHKKVGQKKWDEICRMMESMFKENQFEDGVLKGIHEITYLLAKHFPDNGYDNPDELPNHPVIV